jgi:hypothetical protein
MTDDGSRGRSIVIAADRSSSRRIDPSDADQPMSIIRCRSTDVDHPHGAEVTPGFSSNRASCFALSS